MSEAKDGLDVLRKTRRKAVDTSTRDLVRVGRLAPDRPLPLLVEPSSDEVDLVSWLAANRPRLDGWLREHGGVLFRGFDVGSVEDFQRLSEAACSNLVNYFEGSSPRVGMGDKVYTSTEYPAQEFVSLHNEISYAHRWPRKILFFSLTPAQEGGETPIADGREVFAAIDPEHRRRFVESGVRYVRNLHGGRGAGLSWQQVFETDDRQEVEAYCREGDIELRWKDDGGLWTCQQRPAAIRHPDDGEWVWFNQAHQFHPSNLDEDAAASLRATLAEEDFPLNATFGDGEPIPEEALRQVRRAYDRAMTTFPWQRGDLMVLDNMRVAHGRMPFKGERKTLAAMGETVYLKDVAS